MNKIELLENLVCDFYESHRETWIPYWTEYLYKNHIFFVANLAKEIATELWVNPEFSQAASLLHDIADAKVDRKDPQHSKLSEEIALELLSKAWFTQDEIVVIVYDIIRYHSCTDWKCPKSLEWQIMTSADAIYHIVSDFFDFATFRMKERWENIDEIKAWWLKKIEKDYFVKIPFENIRERYQSDYERCKNLLFKL